MKMLLVVACLQLLIGSVFMQRSGDYWDQWGPYGECSRTCGVGVTMRTRRCITQRTDGGINCVGPDRSYRTCNIQDCPEGSKDFREEQCSQFDGTDFQGKHYKWLPYYGAENPCELNCMPRGENFFYRHRASVVDGTPCHPGRKDVCVEGVCKRLGCDNTLESGQQEDPCLQCGGNGQSCYLVKNTFSTRDLPKGYNQMLIIPVGATSIRIRESVSTRNYLAIKNLRGEYYLNGHWVIEFSRAIPIAGTMLYYQRGTEGNLAPENIIGRGPTTEPLVIELITQEPNQGVEIEYYLPHGRPREGYYWSHGSWSTCSKDCGTGYQSRQVFCAIDNEVYADYLCDSLRRPPNNRTCNTHQCPETRRLAYVYEPQPWRPRQPPRVFVQVYSWRVGEWNQCSVTCGGGSQVRRVECVSNIAGGARVVEDRVCEAYAPRPLSQRTCNMQQCAQYSVSGWSQCSVSCGMGEQHREVVCVGTGGARLEDLACRMLLRPLSMQPCQMPACRLQVSWHIGDWGLCSKSCESGLRERQVICSDRLRNLYPVDQCSMHPKPSTVESCNNQACYSPQLVPSMPDPTGHDNTVYGFRPFQPEESSPAHRPDLVDRSQVNTVYDPYSTAVASHCSQSTFGCCSDGRTPAQGRGGQGCPRDPSDRRGTYDPRDPYNPRIPTQPSCNRTRYGCCRDGVTAAQGPNKEGCVEHTPSTPTIPNTTDCRRTTYGCCHDGVTAARGPYGEGCPNAPNHVQRSGSCDLPHTAGSCDQWTGRYYFDPVTSNCLHFWYGGCNGNSNNFASREECQRACLPAETARGSNASRGSAAQRHGSGPSLGATVRLGVSAATQAHRARLQLRARRPAPSATQNTQPAASWPSEGVSIDKSDPSSVEGLVGQTVVLPCRVSPPPSASVLVEWKRDGVPLDPSRHKQQPNGSMLLGPVWVQDSGWFLCVATRERERDHRYIYLSVSEASQTVQDTSVPQDGTDRTHTGSAEHTTPDRPQQPSARFSIDHSGSSLVEGRVGQTARLYCTVLPTSAMASVSIQWSRDGQPLSTSRHIQHTDGTLVISQLKGDDSGVYTCSASTNQQLEQRQIQLRILGDLRITTAPSDVQVPQGSTAQLPCVVSGDNVNVGWSRNGVPVRPDGRRIQVSADGGLILNNVQMSDEGSYTCNAYTGTYSVSATAEVKVTKPSTHATEGLAGVPLDCVDQPELANCKLIVYARLCASQYYSSFCCASCARYESGQELSRRAE